MEVFSKAPGKLVLTGEYAVLEGAPAIVMAVDRYARCGMSAAAGARSQTAGDEPYLRSLMAAALARGLPVQGLNASLDTKEFFCGAQKLGLGSSAAGSVVFFSALAAFNGALAPTLEEQVALHRLVQQGQGSGLDVAAAHMGGVIEYQLSEEGAPQAVAHRLCPDLHFLFVWTGKPATTSGFLQQAAEYKRQNPESYTAIMNRLVKQAAYCVAANRAFFEAYDAYGEALAAFGKVVGLPVFSPEHMEIQKLAKSCGAVYKPSGAGGGDMGVAIATDPDRLAALKTALARTPFKVIDLSVASAGVDVSLTEEPRRKKA